MKWITTLNIIFRVTYYLELRNAMTVYYTSHFFYQQRLNWLFGHHKTLTTLLW